MASASRFQDQLAMVTGAAQGIGAAVARRLAEEGAEVVLVDRNPEVLAEELDRIRSDVGGASLSAQVLDVADPREVNRVVRELEETRRPLDILVNNAGIIRDGWIERLEDKDWDAVLAVNLSGVFYCCRAAVPGMKSRGYGRIVNVASRAWLGNPGQANYSASKAGVVGLTRTLALELARSGITVNAIAPGAIETPMIQGLKDSVRKRLTEAQPGGRLGTPEEVAATVAFLASREASFVTGQVVHVCGGKSVGIGGTA